MKKPHLLYIGNKLSQHGTTETSIETLGAFLEGEGYFIYYASSQKNKILRLIHMIYVTIRSSRTVKYVLIDTYSTQNFWFALVISQLCRILRLKYITKLHGGNLPARLQNSPFFCKLIFDNAYKITAPSGYLKNAFLEHGFTAVDYIPNTIAIEKYPFLQRKVVVPKLLWVRSFSTIYNPKMAIKVLSILKNDYPNASLCMVGPDKGHLLEECQHYARELNVEVTFTGKLTKEAWIALSKDFSIFINTTHFDNTPVSVIEAMALGLPVVSTNVGGLSFLLKDQENALLIDDNDTDGMIKAIETLIIDPNLTNKIVANARAYVENFDWDHVKYNWFEILK